MVAILLTMPMTRSKRDSPYKLQMHDDSNAVEAEAQMSYDERMREIYDTKNLASIMGRFYSAVSWREN